MGRCPNSAMKPSGSKLTGDIWKLMPTSCSSARDLAARQSGSLHVVCTRPSQHLLAASEKGRERGAGGNAACGAEGPSLSGSTKTGRQTSQQKRVATRFHPPAPELAIPRAKRRAACTLLHVRQRDPAGCLQLRTHTVVIALQDPDLLRGVRQHPRDAAPAPFWARKGVAPPRPTTAASGGARVAGRECPYRARAGDLEAWRLAPDM